MSNNQKNLMSLLVGCVLAFGFLEVLFRLPVWLNDPILPIFNVNSYIFEDEDQVLRFTPGASANHLSWDGQNRLIQINGEGRRGELMPEHGNVVVLLGDSVIFNGGVKDEETLDACLNRGLKNRGKLRFLNYGVSGAALSHYHHRLQHEIIAQGQVKCVYVCFYLNDFISQGVPAFNTSNTQGAVMPEYDYYSYAIAHFGLLIRAAYAVYDEVPEIFKWVNDYHTRAYQQSPEQWSELRQQAEREWGSAWIEKNWGEFDQRIGEMAAMCRENSIEMILVLFPSEIQVTPEFINDEMTYPQRQAKAFAEKWGVPVIDLLPAFRQRSQELLFFDQCHLTPLGNQLAAEELMKNMDSYRQLVTED